MTMYVGNNGSIIVAPESTYGTDPGSGYDTLFGVSSTLQQASNLLTPAHLTISPLATNDYAPTFVDGEIVVNWSEQASVMDELLSSFFTVTMNHYTMTGAPETTSISAEVAFGADLAYIYTGLVATSFGMEISPYEYPTVTMGFIGQKGVKETSPTQGTASVAYLAAPSEFTTVSVGGTTLGAKNVSINCERQYTGGDRAVVGSSYLSQPVESGVRSISVSLTVDLSDDTGFISTAPLDSYLAGTSLGEIIIGSGHSSIALANCRMTGDMPSLGDGLTEFPITATATGISLAPLLSA